MADSRDLEEIRKEKLREYASDASGAGESGADESGATPDEPQHVDGAAGLDEFVGSHDVVLADFYADWCGPCQMLEPVVESVAADTPAAVAKVDVDANQPLATQYGVQGVPTLLLFVEGEPVERLVGMQSEDVLVDLVEQYA